MTKLSPSAGRAFGTALNREKLQAGLNAIRRAGLANLERRTRPMTYGDIAPALCAGLITRAYPKEPRPMNITLNIRQIGNGWLISDSNHRDVIEWGEDSKPGETYHPTFEAVVEALPNAARRAQMAELARQERYKQERADNEREKRQYAERGDNIIRPYAGASMGEPGENRPIDPSWDKAAHPEPVNVGEKLPEEAAAEGVEDTYNYAAPYPEGQTGAFVIGGKPCGHAIDEDDGA